ncbi:hypothetical protein D068_cds19390 [Bacillus atrophaeus UCMB-5137]|nr:hypothetical protein D068_cds19390 [Bacillus atrophaeus UCMB-5137]
MSMTNQTIILLIKTKVKAITSLDQFYVFFLYWFIPLGRPAFIN